MDQHLIHNKKLKADFIQICEVMIKNKSIAVCRIKMAMLFCRLALKEGWDFDTEVHPVTNAAFHADENSRGEDVGVAVYQYLLLYLERSAA
jgi:hypothetical protein